MASKAQQILSNLNNQVQHIPNQQITLPTPQPDNNKAPSERQRSITTNKLELTSEILGKQALGSKSYPFEADLKDDDGAECPQYFTQILAGQIGSLVTSHISQAVESIIRQHEKNTYDSFTKGSNEYLQLLADQTNKKDETNYSAVSNLLSARESKITTDLQYGNMLIHHDRNLINKRQLQLLEQLDHVRMIKIKDGQLRNKLDLLHQKMAKFDIIESWNGESTPNEKKMQEEIQKKIVESMDAGNFAIDSQKTKIAREYVRYMQQQRKSFEQRKNQRQSRYDQHEKERQTELKEAQQMRDLAKKQEILQRIEQNRRKREEQQKQIETKEASVQNFLAEYHKKNPLFKIKQKQFEEKIMKPLEKYREEKLNEIRDYRKSVSLNEIKSHEEKYLGKLALQKQKRDEQLKLIKKARKAEDLSHPYYKGMASKRVTEMTKEEKQRSYSLREANKLKVVKMKEYGEVIHKKYKPEVDEDKRKELEKFIQLEMMRKKRVKKIYKQVVDEATQEVRLVPYFEQIPKKDLYFEGNRFLQYSKKMIKRKQKMNATEEVIAQQNKEEVGKLNILRSSRAESEKKSKSVWELRAKQLEQMTVGDVGDAKNFENLKKNIENLDNKAAIKEDLMQKIDLSMEEHIKEKGMLDHYYLQSIKQKMKLLE